MSPSPAPAEIARIDTLLDNAVRDGVAPGIVAAAATPEGTVYAHATGMRDVAAGRPVALDTVFLIASLTKAITTVAALQQVERGRLTLDGNAGDILPELRAVPVLEGFDAAGQPKLRPARRPITLRGLLTHTAGFTYFSWHADTARYIDHAGLPPLFTYRNAALATPLGADPGTAWAYSIGVDWAGKLVEAVTGQNLEDYFRAYIFGPLGMVDSAFRIRPDMRARLAKVYQRQPAGGMQPLDLELPQDPEFLTGGGGIYSTVPDFVRFMRMVLNDGELDGARVLTPASVAGMSTNQICDIEVGRMVTTEAGGHDFELFPGIRKRWSFGFMVNETEAPTGRSAGSLSWAGMINAYCWIDRVRRLAGISMMQFMPFADPAAIDTALAFETAALSAFACPPHQPID